MRISFLIVLLLGPLLSFAQYPQEVMPGQSTTVTSGKDTLWIINNKQFNNALKAGEKLKLCNEIKDTLKLEVKKQKEIIDTLASNVKDLRGGYDRYKVKWEEEDKKNEDLEIKLVKQKRLTKVVGIASAVTASILTAILFIVL